MRPTATGATGTRRQLHSDATCRLQLQQSAARWRPADLHGVRQQQRPRFQRLVANIHVVT